jgi:DNA-binding protein Fis
LKDLCTKQNECVPMSLAENELNGLVDEENSLENTYNKRVLVRWVNNGGLERLPRPLYEVLMRLLMGDSIRKISKDLGIGRSTVRERLEAVRKFVEQEVGKWLA